MKNVYTLPAAKNQTAAGRKTFTSISKLILTLILLVGMPRVGWGQTNPGVPFDLSTGSWTFTGWSANAGAGRYPVNGATGANPTTGVVTGVANANMMFWKTGTSDPAVNTSPSGDYINAYTSGVGFNGNGTSGYKIDNTGGAGWGAAVLSLNTTGRTTIQVSWTGRTISAGARQYAIRLQYRVGNTGPFIDASGTVANIEYNSSTTGNSNVFSTITLPSIVEGKPLIQLLWRSYYTGPSTGTRPVMGVDDITVSSSPSGTPDIGLTDNGTQINAADVSQGTTAHILHKSALAVTTANATLTGMTCTTAGTYVAADITNLKVRYSTDNTLDAGDATLSTYTNPGAAGAKTFPSFTQQSISSGSTGYIFITADVAAGATHNNTISVDALATSNFTFSSGNKSGSTTAGGAQTFKDVTGPSVSTYSPSDGNTAVTINQDLILTFNENVQAGTSGNFVIYNSNGTEFESIPYNDARITFSSNTVTINPTGTFAIGAAYYVQIPATLIRDMAGNYYGGISNNTTWNFTTVAPSVTNVTSTNADGTYKVGDLLTITVTFNDIVVVTGSPNLLLNMAGTDRQAAYSDGTGTNTLSFTHTIVATDGATDLDYVNTSSLNTNGGSINSLGGVAATRTLATPGTTGSLGYNKNIVVDGVAPTVNTYNPSDGNTSVAIDQSLILTFNENVKLGTSGNIVIYNAGGTVFETIPYNDGRITFSTNTVTINPTSLFSYSSDYYIQTTGSPITDMYDNVYAGINNATTWNFSTVCGPVTTFPYNIDFSTYLPSCWGETAGLLENTSTLSGSTSTWAVDGYANNGSTGSARINIYGTTAKDWLITPTIDLGSLIDYQLEFDIALTAYASTGIPETNGSDDKLAVVISIDNGTTWSSSNTIMVWDNAGSANVYNALTPAGTHVNISLAGYTGQVKIGFYGESIVSNADNDLFIDNVSVSEIPSCVVPTLVTSSSVTSTTATISWTASVSSPSNGYQYEIRTSGAAGSGATGLAVSGTTSAGDVDAAITGLTDNTTYNVYVRSDCGSGDYSSWTTAYTFTTAGIEAPTANAASSVGSEGFTANWNTIDGADYYKIDVYTEIAGSNATDLFISEYVEGSASVEKYIEIYNGTGADVNLSNYKLQLFSNGNAIANEEITLSGTLVNASTVVYKNSASSAYSGASNVSNTVINFNGDDAVALRKITPAGYVDIFGRIGSDPGSAWTSTSNSTVDKTLVRKQTVSGGVTTNPSGTGPSAFTTLEAEWSQYNLEDITHLGSHTYSGSTSQTFIVNNQTVNGISYTITGLNPNTVYKYRVRAVGINSTSTNSNVITVTTDFGTKVSTEAGDWNTITWNPAGVPTEDDNVTINHAVTLAGNADCNDLTIGSGSLTLASGASIITRGAVSGDVTVNRDLTGGVWHFISSPVTTATSNVFNGKYLQYFTESDSKYHDIIETNYGLSVTSGYASWSAGAYNASFTGGSLNTGNYSNIALSKSGDGWNLVGNPYPSALDWSLVTGSNLEGAIYIENGGSWATWNNNVGIPNNNVKYISPCQGFFVQANGAGAVMNMTNAMRTHTQNAFYKQSDEKVSDMVRLEVSGNGFQDQAIVRLRSEATAEYDGDWDAYKMFGDVTDYPQIYTLGSAPLAINAFRELAPVQVGIRVGLSGAYTIAATEINNLQNVKLEDTKTGIFTDLTSKSYTFDFTAGENEQRFKLHFTALDVEEKDASKTTIYANQQTVYVILDENSVGDIYMYNLAGQLLAAKESATGQVTMGLSAAGVYLVKVITPTETITRKVVIR